MESGYEYAYDGDEEAAAYSELDRMFADFLEEELSDPNSELSILRRDLEADQMVSDFNMKIVRRLAAKKEPFSPAEAHALAFLAGKDDSGWHPFMGNGKGMGDDGGATGEQLEKYAEHIRNYLYKYKDEAREIDPGIDPGEEHVGPMAQDIEKAAPDCVKETPEGVKTVDGERLALVNAGLIGELARRLMELEEKVNGASG